MIAPFSFFTASNILFGRGQAQQAGRWLASHAQRVLLLHGASAQRAAWLTNDLHTREIEVIRFAVSQEPTVDIIRQGVTLARSEHIQAVVSLGGGAVLDAGKAIAALAPASADVTEYLEIIGNGRQLEREPLPFVALPTTSGTGAEVTKNAVISAPEQQRKVSLRDNRMLANLAIIDPALTDHSPRQITLYSGLDAITQVMEPYICQRANPLTDALCRDALSRGLPALIQLMQQESAASRDDMAWLSLCGGLALANAGLGVVHGLAGPLGGMCSVAHGAICGALLPYGLHINHQYSVNNATSRQRIEYLFTQLAQAFAVAPHHACEALRQWSRNAGLGSLQQLGIPSCALLPAAQAAGSSSSMQANPVPLSTQQLHEMLQLAWQDQPIPVTSG